MFSISYVGDDRNNRTLFHIRNENSLDCCKCFLTLFGKTFQIKYSSKFNYFYVAQQVRRERLMLDALTESFIHQLIPERTRKTLTSLERISTVGCSGDLYLRGKLDGEDVFIKVTLTRVQTDSGKGGAMQNEYEKGLLLSQECPYVLRPLYYIQCLPCAVLITPFLHHLRPLREVMAAEEPAPTWLRGQLEDLMEHLRARRLVHRDINGGNLSIGNRTNGPTQLFLHDLAYMTQLDEEGLPVPLNIEGKVQSDIQPVERQNDALCFAALLRTLDEKLAADAEKAASR